MSDEKNEIKDFIERYDNLLKEIENNPNLEVYFIGTLDQMKNWSTFIKTQNKLPYNDENWWYKISFSGLSIEWISRLNPLQTWWCDKRICLNQKTS